MALDSSLSYDGNDDATGSLTLTASTWTVDSQVNVESTAADFSSGDVGERIVLGDDTSDRVELLITSYVSTTKVVTTAGKDVPAVWQSGSITDWAFSRKTFTGLSHLEGKTVGGLSDGAQTATAVVAGGQVTLDTHGVDVHVGIPYEPTMRLLPPAALQRPSTRARRKTVVKMKIFIRDSRGIKAGYEGHLEEYPGRQPDYGYASNVPAYDDMLEVPIAGSWDRDGSLTIKQDAPLPLTVMAVISEVLYGD